MTKRFVRSALLYAILAMVFGVFYREFTKFSGFAGETTLSVMHTHYFMLGMMFNLVMLGLDKVFAFADPKRTGRALCVYHAGLNITGLGLLVRGLTQVQGTVLSRGMDAALSGISGVGHILLGVSMLLMLIRLYKTVKASA